MKTPDPHWKPGTPIQSPVEEMVSLESKDLDVGQLYRLMIGCIVPRPIAFVSTLSKEGKGNLAPFSFFNGVSTTPPIVMISVAGKPGGGLKDTLRNILDTGEFVVNSVNEWFIEAANYTAADYPHGVDEMEKVGFTPLKSQFVAPPRVKQSAVQLECKTHKTIEVGEGPGATTLVLGEILAWHIHKPAYKEPGYVLADQLQAISRLGGLYYGRSTDIFELPRPKL